MPASEATVPPTGPDASALLAWARRLVTLGLSAHALFLCVSIAGTQIGLGFAAAGLLLAFLAGHRPARTPLDLPLVCIAAVSIASDLVSFAGPPSLEMATLWRSLIALWLVPQTLALSTDLGRDLRRLLLLALTGVALAALMGVAQYSTGFDLVHALHLRAEPRIVPVPGVDGRFVALGFFISRLTLSHVIVFLLCAAMSALLSRFVTGRARAYLLVCTLLGAVGLVLTFARAAWLAMGLGVLVLGLLQLGTAQGRRTLRTFALGLGVLIAASLAHPGVRHRLLSAFDLQANSDRLFLWSRALEVIRDHPLFGVGFGNYQRICSAYYDKVDPGFLMRTFAHNSALTLLAETGPLGLFIALFFLWRVARTLLSRHRAGGPLAAGGLAALAAVCFIGLLHDVHIDNKAMFALWFTLSLGLVTRRDEQHAT